MARKGVVIDRQVPVDIADVEVVVELEVDVVVGGAVVGGGLEVLSAEDCIIDEVMLDVEDEEDSEVLDVESELLEADEVVWEAELEVLEAT
jgi:hypothetical protein